MLAFSKLLTAQLPRQQVACMTAPLPTFRVTLTHGGARSGTLVHRSGELQTPTALLYTRRGSPLYLTPDVLQLLGDAGCNFLLDASHFIGNPTPKTLATAPGQGRGFCGLQNRLLVLTGRDSVVYNFRHWAKSTNAAVRVEAFAGGQSLGPDLYNSIAEAFQPDLLVALCDEVPAEAEEDRLLSSVRRSSRWLDSALEAVSAGKLASTGILAPVQGGTSVRCRQRSAEECAARPGVFGFAICGMGTGESPQSRAECINAVLEAIPPDSFRLLQGCLTPAELLNAVAQGIDCFDASFATQATASGYALDLESEFAGPETASWRDDTKFNLLHPQFKEDIGPLVEQCKCFTCQHHTRAYIHHLLVVHEMTASVLLELHNLHQLLLFFADVRIAIAESRFSELRERFLKRRAAFRG